MFYVTKVVKFESAHKLNNYKGSCANLHGHSYRVEITLKGEKLDAVGMLADFHQVKQLANELIISRCDHAYLNNVIVGANPTAEVMAFSFFKSFQEVLSSTQGVDIHSVKVWETSDSYATYMED